MKDDSFNTNYLAIHKELMALKNPKVAKSNQRFFKTEKGDYGEGDLFIGLRVPDIRRIAKKHILLKLSDVKKLIRSKYHEERLAGLILMVMQYQKSNNDIDKKKIFDAYLDLFPYINNWDLVDTSCYKIIGPHLENKRRRFLYQWAKSENLWTRRISIITTLWFIRKGDLEDSFALAKIHLNDSHDLMHKAVGWVLRECGKKDQKQLESFLNIYAPLMPRVMLRYSIEKFPQSKRRQYLLQKNKI